MFKRILFLLLLLISIPVYSTDNFGQVVLKSDNQGNGDSLFYSGDCIKEKPSEQQLKDLNVEKDTKLYQAYSESQGQIFYACWYVTAPPADSNITLFIPRIHIVTNYKIHISRSIEEFDIVNKDQIISIVDNSRNYLDNTGNTTETVKLDPDSLI